MTANASDPIFLPKGFKFSAVRAGIKASGNPDLAAIFAGSRTRAAAVFTKNRIVAAPVQVGRAALVRSRGRVRAVIVNSGNANCATGQAGVRGCKAVCEEMGELLKVRPFEIFPSSTGIIGVPFPAEKVRSHVGALLAGAGASVGDLRHFAEAILTTDTRPKIASVPLRSGSASLIGIAKGSGMIHPQLATMLVYLLTDVSVSPSELKGVLREACDESFNEISVDGDTSTNDTVLLLASAESQASFGSIRKEFRAALSEVCRSLAEQIVSDGEGVQRVIRLHIEQARNRAEALQVARTIANSMLVKTAWAGADPNWGRILAAAGRSGVPLNPERTTVAIGDQVVCKGSVACVFDEQKAHDHLSQAECSVRVKLGRGKASVRFLTTDLTTEYVRINADYST
ncbi:MAG TPA: bifunctional glutamate N-acetyltransferase/amino-acid acetyltransferase ArgJ [Terriglobales bacterium]|jgi:glutamate N-acetyltransferase/amino-acid N-acetyltransferase|nr:bifunctional glutamate N-acetyltransferase/amino-acid acetyltransferase ArgJ [Terriglobales bacterium]